MEPELLEAFERDIELMHEGNTDAIARLVRIATDDGWLDQLQDVLEDQAMKAEMERTYGKENETGTDETEAGSAPD